MHGEQCAVTDSVRPMRKSSAEVWDTPSLILTQFHYRRPLKAMVPYSWMSWSVLEMNRACWTVTMSLECIHVHTTKTLPLDVLVSTFTTTQHELAV